jgi:hypothetical protein
VWRDCRPHLAAAGTRLLQAATAVLAAIAGSVLGQEIYQIDLVRNPPNFGEEKSGRYSFVSRSKEGLELQSYMRLTPKGTKHCCIFSLGKGRVSRDYFTACLF